MNNVAVKISNISKIYKLYEKHSDRLKEAFHPFRKKYHHDFFALKNIDLEIIKGESIGIIGSNGSGKSTLLKIIAGIFKPTSGNISVNGRISAILELGIGLNPELTGLENIYFVGSLLGYTVHNLKSKLTDIINFADIGEYINQPVKTYSSGMFVRLAFAISINVNPDILIIDEALAVGDIRFIQKCLRKIREFQDENKTILFVSHDTSTVINFCSRVLWLKDGIIHKNGYPKDVVKDYISYMTYGIHDEINNNQTNQTNKKKHINDKKINNIEWSKVKGLKNFGEGGAEIIGISLYYKDSHKKVKMLKGGENVIFYTDILMKKNIRQAGVGIQLIDDKGNHVFGINNYIYNFKINSLKNEKKYIIGINFIFPTIKNGDYTLSLSISEGNQLDHIQHHWIHDAYIIHVRNTNIKYKMGFQYIIENVNFEVKTY